MSENSSLFSVSRDIHGKDIVSVEVYQFETDNHLFDSTFDTSKHVYACVADIKLVSPPHNEFDRERIMFFEFYHIKPKPFKIFVTAEIEYFVFEVIGDLLNLSNVISFIQVDFFHRIQVHIDSIIR